MSSETIAANGKYDFAIVGAGRMGASIAGNLALSGARVALYDRSDFDRKKGLEIMCADLRAHENSQLISASSRLKALDNVWLVESLQEVRSHRVLPRGVMAPRSRTLPRLGMRGLGLDSRLRGLGVEA